VIFVLVYVFCLCILQKNLPSKKRRRLEAQQEMLEEESEDGGDTKVGWVLSAILFFPS
jgi:hypothetical protein